MEICRYTNLLLALPISLLLISSTEKGSKLILVGRRQDRLTGFKKALEEEFSGLRVHTVCMSVSDTDAVMALPSALPAEFKDVDVSY